MFSTGSAAVASAEPSKIRVVLLGPPGAGKSTQATKICEVYGIRHIVRPNCLFALTPFGLTMCCEATGNLLRAEMAKKTKLGTEAKRITDAGGLVPDDIVIEMIRAALKDEHEGGRGLLPPDMISTNTLLTSVLARFLLDGFPRTIPQAVQLDTILAERSEPLASVINFTVDTNLILERVRARLVHLNSGRTYHPNTNPPRVAMRDDVTGEILVQRSDDNAETVRKRLASYHESTSPLVDYYRGTGLLREVDASQKPDILWQEVLGILAVE